MVRIILAFTVVVASFHFFMPKLGDLLGIEIWRFLGMSLFLPAVVLGARSWWKTHSFGRSWPVILCVLVAWMGLLYAEETESNRGLLIAACLTMVLPVSALIVKHRCWWHCARVYVWSNVVALGLVFWLDQRSCGEVFRWSLTRLGHLMLEDGSAHTTNPNLVGGQFAFGAVLSFMLYLRKEAAELETGRAVRSDRFSLAWALILSLGCILTASRGAFVAWFGGMGLLLFFGTKKLAASKLRDLTALSGMLLSLAVFLWVAGGVAPWGGLYQRVAGEKSQGLSTLGGRALLWKDAANIWWSNSTYRLVGVGTGLADTALGEVDEKAVVDQYGVYLRSTHSVFVEWVLCFGAVGILSGLCLLLTMWHRAATLDLREGTVNRRAVLVSMLLYSATVVLFRQPGWMALGALVLAMLSEPPAAAVSSRPGSHPAGATLPGVSGPHARPIRLKQGSGRSANMPQGMES